MAAVRAGCSQIGRSSSAMVAKIGSKAGSSSGRPARLVKICTPPAPSSLTARRAEGRKALAMARAQLRHRVVADPRQIEPDLAAGQIFDRGIRQRDDLAVIPELVHLAEA